MNYGELKTAILGDGHREDYTAHVARFVEEAEAHIRARLSAHALETTLTDAARNGDPTTAVYTLPQYLTEVRYVIPTGCAPLSKVDETLVAESSRYTTPLVYAARPSTIRIAGTPSEGAVFELQYYGLPAPLTSDTDTNTLLTAYPQLYKELAQVPLFKRAKDFEAAQIAFQSANSLIDVLNDKMRRQLSGARASNPYNVRFRSSY